METHSTSCSISALVLCFFRMLIMARWLVAYVLLDKNINVTWKVLVPCFMSWKKRSQKFSIRTKSLFLSIYVHKFVYVPVSEHFWLCQDNPSTWQVLHVKKLITGWSLHRCTCTLKCAVLSHNTMTQMSQVLREHAVGMLTAGISTRAVARELNVHFSTISHLQHVLMSMLWTECPMVAVGLWYGQA